MASLSSPPSGGSLSSTSISGLDANGDGIDSAEELAAAEKASGRQHTQNPTVQNENAASGLPSRIAGGMMSLLVKGGFEDAQKLCTRLKVIVPATSLGGVESLAEHLLYVGFHFCVSQFAFGLAFELRL